MSQINRWQQMAGILVERTARASASDAVGSGGTGQILQGTEGDDWDYKAEDDVWFAKRKSGGDWISLANKEKSQHILDEDNPNERTPEAIRATAQAVGKNPDQLGWIPVAAPPPPESGGDWEDVVRAPRMELPMDYSGHEIQIGDVTDDLLSHDRGEMFDWWEENRQYYLTITDLLRDLSHGLRDDPALFPDYSQNEFKNLVPREDYDVQNARDIDDLGDALNYFRRNHTKKRARAVGTKYVEEDANAIDYYIRSLANQTERAEEQAQEASAQNVQAESTRRRKTTMTGKSERLDLQMLREAIRDGLLVEQEGGRDSMKTLMMMQMALPLVQQGVSSLKGLFKKDPEAESRLSQLMQQNPRIADAAALYGALEPLGTDEEVVRAMIQKNAGDLPGLSRDFTTAVAAITNGEETGELVSMLKSDGMDEEADQVLAAITDPSSQAGSEVQQQQAPLAAQAGMSAQQMGGPQMSPMSPTPGAGQPGMMAESREGRFRKLIRQELLKII